MTYYEENKEKIKARVKAYQEANKEKVAEQKKNWKEGKGKDYNKSYYQANKEKMKEQAKAFYYKDKNAEIIPEKPLENI